MAGPSPHRARAFGVLAFTACALGAGDVSPARAQQPSAATPLRVVVRVCGARDQQALQRLRGQTSDLPLALLVREDSALEPLLAAQLDRAQALSRELDAAAVVWFSAPAEGSLVVYVATPGDGRVFARRLESGAGTAARDAAGEVASALLEQSALVIRFALKGLTAGGTIGVERSAALADAQGDAGAQQAAAAVAAAAPPGPEDTDPEERGASERFDSASASSTGDRSIWLGLGYEAAIDGFAPEGQHALAARGAWAVSGFEVALAASGGMPVTRAEPLVTLRVVRVRAGTGIARLLELGGRFALTAGVHAGVLLQLRETIDAELPARARPARWSAAFQIGPETALLYRAERIGLRLCAALDVLPSPTRFAYREGGRERESAQPFSVQPRFGLAMELAP